MPLTLEKESLEGILQRKNVNKFINRINLFSRGEMVCLTPVFSESNSDLETYLFRDSLLRLQESMEISVDFYFALFLQIQIPYSEKFTNILQYSDIYMRSDIFIRPKLLYAGRDNIFHFEVKATQFGELKAIGQISIQ